MAAPEKLEKAKEYSLPLRKYRLIRKDMPPGTITSLEKMLIPGKVERERVVEENNVSGYYLFTSSDTFGGAGNFYFHHFVTKASLDSQHALRKVFRVLTIVSRKPEEEVDYNHDGMSYYYTKVPEGCPTPSFEKFVEEVKQVAEAIRKE